MLLDHGHFDTILSIPWISDHQHYCDDCDVGYSYIEEHRTTCQHRYRCSFCLSETPPHPPPLGTQLHRMFRMSWFLRA